MVPELYLWGRRLRSFLSGAHVRVHGESPESFFDKRSVFRPCLSELLNLSKNLLILVSKSGHLEVGDGGLELGTLINHHVGSVVFISRKRRK